jgi:DNA-binding GntR family transcriptional regulator
VSAFRASGVERIPSAGGLRDFVYRAIRQWIASGEIAAGKPLTETLIATKLKVSRTPVREVFVSLEREGLLAKSGRSYVVRLLDQEEINEVCEMRLLIEPPLIKKIIESARPADILDLEAALLDQKNADSANDSLAFIASNARFRALLFALVANRRLRRSIELNNDHMQFVSSKLHERRSRGMVVANLTSFMQAMMERDGVAGQKLWADHIRGSHAAACDWLQEMTRRSIPRFSSLDSVAAQKRRGGPGDRPDTGK